MRSRAQALDNPEARQKVLLELYERFFQVALKKGGRTAGYRLHAYRSGGLHSALGGPRPGAAFRAAADQREDVHILDPFTGTGTFIVRLLKNPELIQCDEDLVRKFTSEMHAQ